MDSISENGSMEEGTWIDNLESQGSYLDLEFQN